jgi:hypothetical protein
MVQPPRRKGWIGPWPWTRANQARISLLDVTEPVTIGWDLEQQYGLKLTETLSQRRLDELEVLTEPYADAGVTGTRWTGCWLPTA